MCDAVPLVIFLNDSLSSEAGWMAAGGKGSNLLRLAQAGFPVPDAFIFTTRAYHTFIKANQLDARILAALPDNPDDPEALTAASAQIHRLFSTGRIPDELAESARQAYRKLGSPAVAVRSSATAEDLPEMSFAGQQDTYLNVIGEQALLDAIRNCWASLWTARAIGYRARNGVAHAGAALAVVVQQMVPAEVAGVLFTANPLSGLRSQTAIDATYGLGEALVSGQVEPDHYEVDTRHAEITARKLGSKSLVIRGRAGGGTLHEALPDGGNQALPDGEVLALAQLGQRVAAFYGQPQDIEWAWADGHFHLLQSRAVTSLFPTPAAVPAEPLQVFFSFGAVQGMLDPLTPVGRDMIRRFFVLGARLLNYHVTAESQTVLFDAGERLWIRITPLLRNTVGRKVLPVVFSQVEPSTFQAIAPLLDEPGLQPEHAGISWRSRVHLAHFIVPMAGNVLLNMLSPRARRKKIIARGERLLGEATARIARIEGQPRERLAQLVSYYYEFSQTNFTNTLLLFISVVAAGMASFNLLRMKVKDLPPDAANWMDVLLKVTRGLANNPTTGMDLALWDAARTLRADAGARAEFETFSATELAQRWLAGGLHPVTSQVLSGFLQRYGGRGLGEIDLGRPRWAEDPTHVFEVLSGYLQIPADQAPDVVFARGAADGEAALAQLIDALRKTHAGWFKSRQAHFLGRRVRELMGARESPKFFMVRLFAQFRWTLLHIGAELVRAGELRQPEDLFFLDFSELQNFAMQSSTQPAQDWGRLIDTRREAYRRELLRRQVPRVLLSDGRAFYNGLAGNGHKAQLTGSPVSPGMVEGHVRVVLDPRRAGLLPGEILVCPGTDPSWTPLFLTAGGLIMEVGGMMTHGAVVAREYGIPAAVGVDHATGRLRTGQRVRLNGSNGLIELLEEESGE
jgi:pyruvate,water dikinase